MDPTSAREKEGRGEGVKGRGQADSTPLDGSIAYSLLDSTCWADNLYTHLPSRSLL